MLLPVFCARLRTRQNCVAHFLLFQAAIAESIPLKFPFTPCLPVSVALLIMMSCPTHLLAQTAADQAAPTPQPQADINTMPKWSEFPVPPTNITTPAEFQADVTQTLQKRQQLQSETSALVWDDTVPETFAEDARGRLDPAHLAPIDAQVTPAQIDAQAAELRKRAAPPPIIK